MNFQVYYKYNLKENISAGLRKISNNLHKMDGAFSASTTKNAKGVDRLHRKLSGLLPITKRLSAIGIGSPFGKFTTYFAGTALIYKGAKTLGDYDEKLASLRANLKGTNVDFANLANRGRKLAANSAGFNPLQVLEAQKTLVKKGVTDPSQIMGTVGAGISLGEAEQVTDLTRLVQLLSTVQTTYRGIGKEIKANKLADMISTATTASNLDVLSFQGSLKNIMSTIKTTKMSFADVLTSQAILADLEIKKGVSGTRLKQVANKIKLIGASKVDSKEGKLFDELGFDYQKLAGGNIRDIIEEVTNAGKHLPDLVRESLMTKLFGQRPGEFISVLDGMLGKYDELKDKISNATSVKDKARDASNNLNADYKKLTSAITEFTLSTGDNGMTKGLRQIVSNITNVFKALSGMEVKLGDVGTAFVAYVEPVLNNLPAIFKGLAEGSSGGLSGLSKNLTDVILGIKDIILLFAKGLASGEVMKTITTITKGISALAGALSKVVGFTNMLASGPGKLIGWGASVGGAIENNVNQPIRDYILGNNSSGDNSSADNLKSWSNFMQTQGPSNIMSKVTIENKSDNDVKVTTAESGAMGGDKRGMNTIMAGGTN